MLEGIILKPNMVLPGLSYAAQSSADDVASQTTKCLLRTVPAAVPGITFLSGGQSGELASERLNAICKAQSRLPWQISFSFARALQQHSLDIWRGNEANIELAQKGLLHRARCNQAARSGAYIADSDSA